MSMDTYDAADAAAMKQAVESIALHVLGLQTLETRWADSLDFKEQAVWSIKEALEQAFDAGRRYVKTP